MLLILSALLEGRFPSTCLDEGISSSQDMAGRNEIAWEVFPFSKRNSFQWKSLDMQMLDFETAQCCSMFFKAVLVFFFLRCFSNSRGQNSPATKLHDCKLPFALLGIGAWWMNGWMNEIPYTTMQWNESQRSIGKHVLFVFGGDRVVFADGPDLDSWHTVPTVIGSLRQQPASHKVGPHWLLRSISTLSSNLCSYQPQLIVCLELSHCWTNLFTTPQVYALLLFGGKLHVDHQQVLQYTVEENVMMVC